MDTPLAAFAELFIYFTILLLTLYGIVLWYHWSAYSANQAKTLSTMTVYTIGSIVLVAALFLAFSFI